MHQACLRGDHGPRQQRGPRRSAAWRGRCRPAAAAGADALLAASLCRRLGRKAVDHIKSGAQLRQGGLVVHEPSQHAQRDARGIPRRRRRRPSALQEGQQTGVLRHAVRYGPQVQLQAVDQAPSAIHQPARVVQLQRRGPRGGQQHRRRCLRCSCTWREADAGRAHMHQRRIAVPQLPKRHSQRQRAADGCRSGGHDINQHNHRGVDVVHLHRGAQYRTARRSSRRLQNAAEWRITSVRSCAANIVHKILGAAMQAAHCSEAEEHVGRERGAAEAQKQSSKGRGAEGGHSPPGRRGGTWRQHVAGGRGGHVA